MITFVNVKGGIKIEPETNIEQCLKCRYKYYDDEGVYCSVKPIIYLSHAYGGKQSNADEVAMVMLKLVKRYPDLNFFSPIHNFPFYNDLNYETGLQKCLDFLPYCQEMWIIGDWRESRGCQAEIKFCKQHHIPIKLCTVEEVMNG